MEYCGCCLLVLLSPGRGLELLRATPTTTSTNLARPPRQSELSRFLRHRCPDCMASRSHLTHASVCVWNGWMDGKFQAFKISVPCMSIIGLTRPKRQSSALSPAALLLTPHHAFISSHSKRPTPFVPKCKTIFNIGSTSLSETHSRSSKLI